VPIDAAIAAVATLLTKVFGFVVDPDGLAMMRLEHRIEVIAAGVRIAIKQKDLDAVDRLFTEYRQLSKTLTP
jgi:hypothetical protein